MTPPSRARAPGPVPEQAIRDLLASVSACGTQRLVGDPLAFVDVPVAAREARKFKLDVSFCLALDGRPRARFSVNDTGEAEAFRERLHALADLGLRRELLDDFLALSSPGAVQTTLALKWGPAGGRPERISLYFEELMREPSGRRLVDSVFRYGLGAVPEPVPAHFEPAAVCLDHGPGGIVAGKDYWMVSDREGDQPQVPWLPTVYALRMSTR